MKPRTKFLIGGALVIGTAGYLAASAIKMTDGAENAPEKYKDDTPGYKRAEQRA